tara:strand:- start:42 stop:356 length:315 start_codon:yes stop_codon:yes gene_type:complete
LKKINLIFSIIIPTYNRAEQIAKTIKSCLEQSYANFEVIIVDDGSATKGMTNIHLEGSSKKLSKLFLKKNVNNKMHKKFKKINLATDENNFENAVFLMKNQKFL